MAQLVGILGAAPPAELVDAVFARSEGNPLFTEELLGAIKAGSGELPPTVRDLLHGRVQALPEPAQQALAVVAVAGKRVSHQLLAAVAGLEEQPLVRSLRAAVDNQLLVTRPDQDGYELRHALLAEVILADLLPGERARLHAAHARTLTERPELADASPAVAVAEVAVHWDAAGEWAQALPARVRAGLAAERARALAEADSHYQRALTLWERVPGPGQPGGLDWVGLLARAAETAAFVAAPERATRLVEQALGAVDRTAEPVRAAELLAQLGFDRDKAGQEAEALAAAVAWERLAYPFEAAYARFRQGEALLAGGSRHQQAETVLRPALQTAVALGAAPLRREIELLAQRGRLRLEDHAGTVQARPAPSPVASLGLTRREAEVLALLAEGRTNRQIGQALFITEKTASLHVSHILAKLGVAGRGEAAAVAHRLGLDQQ
jgi:DNA-binding CsgD family transcriptional regulator